MFIFLAVVGVVLFLFWLSSSQTEELRREEHEGRGGIPRRRNPVHLAASELRQLLALVPRMVREAALSVRMVYRAHRCRKLCRDLVENLCLIPPDQIHVIEPTLHRLIREMQELADRNDSNARDVLQLLYEMRDAIWRNDALLALKDGRLALSALDIKSYVK